MRSNHPVATGGVTTGGRDDNTETRRRRERRPPPLSADEQYELSVVVVQHITLIIFNIKVEEEYQCLTVDMLI